MIKRVVLLSLFASAFAFAGCSTSDDTTGPGPTGTVTITPPSGCTVDTSVGCDGSSTGFSCAIGDNPESEDTTLSCSDPNTDGPNDTYCCFTGFTGSATTCQSSDDITGACPDPTSLGFTCAAGDNPENIDPTLVCSASTADGDSDDFCCNATGTASTGGGGGGTVDTTFPSGCNADPAISAACPSGTTGYACDVGANPESDDATRLCSEPNTDSSNEDDYCCTETGFTAGSCVPDDGVSDGCAAGSYGFTCAAGDTDPASQDPSLDQCSAPADGGDSDLYCCTYQ